LSQVLTLYTTPVIYIFFDTLGERFFGKGKDKKREGPSQLAEQT